MAEREANPIVEEFEACSTPQTKRRRTCGDSLESPLARAPLLLQGHRKVATPASAPREKRSRPSVAVLGAPEVLAAARAVSEDAGSKEPTEASAMGRRNVAADAMSVIASIIEHHTCPITQQVLVDPVQAEDGHVYERQALERWLARKRTSPMTNRAMGATMADAMAARQTVRELAENGMLNQRTSLQFFTERGRLRATRLAGPGPDLEGARSDFERSLELSTSPAQQRVAELQINAVAWMQDGVKLFAQARKLQAESGNDSAGHGLESWMLHLGDATEAATWPLRMTKWMKLPKGARVKVLDDPAELRHLCERAPSGAHKKVGWVSEMIAFAGRVCIVQQKGETSHQNYILRRLGPPAGRDFSFPYDALLLLAGQEEEEEQSS